MISLRLSAPFLGLTLAVAAPASAQTPQPATDPTAPFYRVERVPTPTGIDPQVGGLAALPDGRLAAAFHRGEVALYNPKTGDWQVFAEGLHEPLGLTSSSQGGLLVMQRAELTRLRDTDGDEVADHYETVWDDFGLSGNYHEFAFGPARGPDGRLYVGLNVASGLGTVTPEIRGDWTDIGVPREEFYTAKDWSKMTPRVGRMFSRVRWRGWVMAVDEVTGRGEGIASGFRSPDGLGFDEAGNLLVDDNQGDWRGSSEVHVVRKGGFYGHAASLVWRDDWDGTNPLEVPTARLNDLRTRAAIWTPHASYAASPTQMVVIPRTPAWGDFGGQMVVGEMNSPRLLRLLHEEVGGVWQGACIVLVETPALRIGLHRLAFIGDTLYVGRTHLSWAGDEGIAAVTPTGREPFDIVNMKIVPGGFELRLTKPVAADAAEPARWTGHRYTYNYSVAYGSPEENKVAVVPERVTLSADRQTVRLQFADLQTDVVYDLRLPDVRSAAGEPLLNPGIAYTVRKLP